MAHTAVVTGALGFVATELVKQLLVKGYTVRATCRSKADADRMETLLALGRALPGALTLHEADLLTDGSFDEAVKGAHYVFHVASPFQIDVADPERDLVRPAVQGTLNVLGSCARSKDSVRRVIVTSSVAAVHGNNGIAPPVGGGPRYDERDFNATSSLQNGEAYWVSKTSAERAAWEFAAANGLDMVAVLPNFVLGPLTSPRADGLSVGFLKGWLEGSASDGAATVCDVRDVAAAHVLAAETPAASGRYIVSNAQPVSPRFISQALRERFPELHIPDGLDVSSSGGKDVDSTKVQKELGLGLTPVRSTLVDMAATLLALGVAKPTAIS